MTGIIGRLCLSRRSRLSSKGQQLPYCKENQFPGSKRYPTHGSVMM